MLKRNQNSDDTECYKRLRKNSFEYFFNEVAILGLKTRYAVQPILAPKIIEEDDHLTQENKDKELVFTDMLGNPIFSTDPERTRETKEIFAKIKSQKAKMIKKKKQKYERELTNKNVEKRGQYLENLSLPFSFSNLY